MSDYTDAIGAVLLAFAVVVGAWLWIVVVSWVAQWV